ncbi:MAG: NAD(P)/FAD-dependent oxidoreductase [Minisyncoccia bacterium]
MKKYDVIVIGGGPAGLMAANTAAKNGAKVLVLEKNSELGKKLLLTGGGRCNLTNAEMDVRKFVSKFDKKGQVLFSPFSVFGVKETIEYFNVRGLETKIEPGNRVFPVTDKAIDVLNILIAEAKKYKVEFIFGVEVTGFEYKKGSITGIKSNREIYHANNYILATGGMSHQETGSTGDGFNWLKEIGHNVITPQPSLVPVKVLEKWVKNLSGVGLDMVGINLYQNKKVVAKKTGKILFTHFGLSGPAILNFSKTIRDYLAGGNVLLKLDLFPGVGLDKLEDDFQNLIKDNLNKLIKNLTWEKLPTNLLQTVFELAKIDTDKQLNSLTREERLTILTLFKAMPLTVIDLLGFEHAIISSGGVDINEVEFKTMQSKIYKNLFLVGDVLDFDRPSGGFSLQLCWTTGYVAGNSIK